MANILYYPQCSMYDKTTKKLLPECDGNINMMRNTINEWKKNHPDDKFFVLIPKGVFIPHYIDLKINCQYLTYDNYVVSARINRFNFPMNEFISILKNYKFDLIINDVIEITGNFKQMFRVEFGYAPKIISNVRHLDDNVNYSYMYRVIDGIIQSDITTILSGSMKSKIYEQIEDLTNYNITQDLNKKIEKFEPSISATELGSYSINTVIKDLNKVIITFPGRLSIGEERRTNWDKFIEAINKLRQKRQDFEIYFTDPNNAINPHYIDTQNWIKTIDKDRDKFLNLLNKTDVIVSLMDIEGFGGISIREALLMDCMPIIPEVHEYKKMAPKDYVGFVSSPIDVDDLVNALEWAIINIKKNRVLGKLKYDYREYGMQFSIEEQFKKLLPKVEELLND